jgi:hypothetical protein
LRFRPSPASNYLHYKLSSFLTDAAVFFLAPAASRKVAPLSVPKVSLVYNVHPVVRLTALTQDPSLRAKETGALYCPFCRKNLSPTRQNHCATGLSSRTRKFFMTRSASCPTASGSSKTRWRRHMPCTAGSGIPFCRMNYCKSNVPWNGNRGTKCLLHRKPKPRKPSTLWDLCERDKNNVKLLYSHFHSQVDLRYRSNKLLWSDSQFIRRFLSASLMEQCHLSFVPRSICYRSDTVLIGRLCRLDV